MRTALAFACLVTATFLACAQESSEGSNSADITASTNKIYECTPVDSEEACSDQNTCIAKLVVKTAGAAAAALSIERADANGHALPAEDHAEAVSFALKNKSLLGSWNDGEIRLSAKQIGPIERYAGEASVPDVGSFAVDCRLAGAPILPTFVKTAKVAEECNGQNDQGQIIRCVRGARCDDENGDEIAVFQPGKGICDPILMKTAKHGEACNVSPPDTVALVQCARGAGSCKNARGEAIPLAQSTEAGTCQ